jgi:hypothetical protein
MNTALVSAAALMGKNVGEKTLYVFITFSLKPSERQVPSKLLILLEDLVGAPGLEPGTR